MYLNLDLKGLEKEVLKHKVKKVFVQLPEGLKTRIKDIKYTLSKYDVYFSVDPIFGACDLQEHLAESVNADLIIHFGHNKFSNSNKFKVIYWPTYYVSEGKEETDLIKRIESKFKNKTISFIFPIQYYNIVESIKEKLKNVKVIEPRTTNRINIKGQVLGCDASTIIPIAKKLDAIIYIGDGYFHPTAFINFPTSTKVYRAFPFEDIEQININKKEMDRRALLPILIKSKETFGIYITRKTGQNDLESASNIKTILENNGKEVFMFVSDTIDNSKLLGMGIEVLVNTACPRLMDDYKNYKPIIVNVNIVKKAFS